MECGELVESLKDRDFVEKCLLFIDSLQDKKDSGNHNVWMGWKGADLRKATVLVTKMRERALTDEEIEEARGMLRAYYPQFTKFEEEFAEYLDARCSDVK